jgi:hypothetical protein
MSDESKAMIRVAPKADNRRFYTLMLIRARESRTCCLATSKHIATSPPSFLKMDSGGPLVPMG